MRRPGSNAGKANALGEETGASTLGATGVGVQTRTDRSAEIASGRTVAQQGLAATCKDPSHEAKPEAGGGQWSGAWARRSDEGGVTPTEEMHDISHPAVTPTGGKGALGTWRSQGGARILSREKPTLEAGTSLWANRRARGGCEPALEHRYDWEGPQRRAKVRTGLGKSHRPGSQGGLWKRGQNGSRNEAHWETDG